MINNPTHHELGKAVLNGMSNGCDVLIERTNAYTVEVRYINRRLQDGGPE